MKNYYTDEENAQIVVALLKKHNIKKIVASPGTTNINFVRSVQIDSFFDVYSSADERSAAYIACGLAAETGESVAISCTGATASRNYLPGLTEAYYRKLPILAITSTRDISKYGHHEDQVIDRSMLPKDVVKVSVTLPTVKDKNDLWECEIKTNRAILELKRNGGGPSHINLTTKYTRSFTTEQLPEATVVNHLTYGDNLPSLPKGKIGVFVGSHKAFTENQIFAIEKFCLKNDAIIFCDHTSNYKGKYKVLFPIIGFQNELDKKDLMPDILIHIGEISGFYGLFVDKPKEVWRISEDGELRDTFHKLRYIFQMKEQHFFENYSKQEDNEKFDNYFQLWKEYLNRVYFKIPELPFSNIWVAQQLSQRLPENSVIHFGILNSLTAWNYFQLSNTLSSYSNVGGFGIDGCISSFIGASLAHKDKLYFGVFGDLAFFYDINVLGNRHIGKNLRILLINNGKGMEFKIKNNPATQFGDATDEFIAAAGHYGNKSVELIKHYSTDLGFDYITASTKEEFENVYEDFINPNITDKSILFEVFTKDSDENSAQILMSQIEITNIGKTKQFAKNLLGENGIKTIKKLLR